MKIKCLSILCLSMLLGLTSCGSFTKSTSNKNNSTELGSVLSDMLGSVLNTSSSLTADDLVGTWKYEGAACVFKSDDLLAKAGGEIAAANCKNKLDNAFQNVGIKKGGMSLTLNADKTFDMKVGSHDYTGTYEYNSSNQGLTFSYLNGLGTSTATISRSNESQIQMLYEAKKLYSVLSAMKSLPVQNTSFGSVISLLGQYNGIMAGVTMQK